MQHLTVQQIERLNEIKGLNNATELLLESCYKTLTDSLCDFFSDEYEKAEKLRDRLNNQRQLLRIEMLTIMGF